MKNVEDYYPLSPMQQGMLFHSLSAPTSGMYHEQVSFSLHGQLDVAAFRRAWEQVVGRHSVLRTSFVWEDLDDPIQVVHREVPLHWDQQDWRGISREQQTERFAAYLQTDRERGFDLSHPPLMRLALMRMADDDHKFLWSYHHALLDGWSVSLVLKELYAFYEAFCHGRQIDIEPSRPFRAYIKWLKQLDLSEAENFWRAKLKGFAAPTPLPAHPTYGRLADDEKDYDSLTMKLPAAITELLQRFVRQHHLTLNTVVQGAWAMLLSRHSGEKDVVFGATVAGRPTALDTVETMIGVFINTVPVRVEVSPSDMVLPWLKQLQSQFAELRKHEYASLVQIQGWSEIPRGLFESLLIFENFPMSGLVQEKSGGLKIGEGLYSTRINYPLTLMVVPEPEMALRIMYDGKRFEANDIGRLLDHYRILIEGLVDDPHRRVCEIPILTQAERRQLILEWNSTRADYPQLCVHELFEAQVERVPDAIAVILPSTSSGDGERQLTYRQLNDKAERLARKLRSMGVRPGVVVGICTERSLEMVVGLLAILKAGGAYVPIDPAYPAARIEFMMEDSAMNFLLTQERLRDGLPQGKHRVASVEELSRDYAVEMIGGERAHPDDLAYVIYTSGSTGKPKGVEIQHRALVNFLHSMKHRPGLTPQDVLLSVTTISFDIAALELFLPLIVGARVVLISREAAVDGRQLIEHLKQSGATVMQATPATWRMLVEQGWNGNKSLKLLCGGEALSPDLAKALLERSGSVWNLYGPTETTVWSTVWKVVPGSDRILIGRPIDNTEAYILDSSFEPVPVGVAGELYLGGDGLASGYRNRAEATAARFVDNPFDTGFGSRLYKTGDWVRYLPDGNIEILGRIDDQVKIRGFRIELGEIEATLSEHPGVRQGVVTAREDERLDRRLMAYVVPKAAPGPTAAELRNYLKSKLPEHMIPSSFVLLDALPLTPNGKVDRKALPFPDGGEPRLKKDFVSPRTTTEKITAGIFCEILGVDEVSIDDNFFDLGGHSLLAARVIARLRNTFHLELPLRVIFESPTPAGLADSVETLRRAGRHPQARPDCAGEMREEGAI